MADSTTLRRKLIGILDRPGGRGVLSAMATWFARRHTQEDVSIFYDHGWMHRIGSDYFSDDMTFNYYVDSLANWEFDVNQYCCDSRDYWFHVYQPKPGDVIIDVGAGVGKDTMLFSRSVGRTGRVVAVEAHPTTFRRLERVCKHNRLQNVLLRQCAIMDRQSTVFIEDNEFDETNAIVLDPSEADSKLAVPAMSLNQLCEEVGVERIDFLKINIEGAERLAMKGASRAIQNTKHVCIACHDFQRRNRNTRDEVISFLKANKFDLIFRDDDPRSYVRDHIHGVSSVAVS